MLNLYKKYHKIEFLYFITKKKALCTEYIYRLINRCYHFNINFLEREVKKEMEKIRKYFFKSFAFLISALAISTVNSACIIAFGQEKEPDSLKRFKKCDD